VGVYEEGEEKRALLYTAEQLKEKLPKLNDKLEQYKYRKEQIQFIRNSFLTVTEQENETDIAASIETSVMDKGQGLHILESHEHDRNRIARDLHDSSVQSLTALVHKTELCIRLMDMDTVRVKLELQTMIETIKTIINGMREIIFNLRPMSIDNLGLTIAIDSYCLQLKKSNDIDVEFHNQTEEPNLSSISKITLYRILQEACYNVIKHAHASKIDITLSCTEDGLRLTVQDNGRGFDVLKLQEPSDKTPYGFGVSMMRERAVLLGGAFRIESIVDEGTTVFVDVPLQEKEDNSGDY
jgi:two-component system sensor histidine kinase DegS